MVVGRIITYAQFVGWAKC